MSTPSADVGFSRGGINPKGKDFLKLHESRSATEPNFFFIFKKGQVLGALNISIADPGGRGGHGPPWPCENKS